MNSKRNISIVGGAGHVGFPLGLMLSSKGYKVSLIDKHVEIKRSYLPNEWFCKYDVDDYLKLQKQWMKYVDSTSIFYIDNEFDERIKMVHFSNYLNQQHKHNDAWIKTYWK